MPKDMNKVQAELKTAVFGQLKSKPLESISEMPDNTLDNNGTKHLVIIDPHNCLEYHINDANPYSDLDFKSTHNFGLKSQNKRTGTYSRGNFARLYDYYSGKVVNQKEEPDSRRIIFSKREDIYAMREIDLSETEMTQMAEIKVGGLPIDSKDQHFLQNRYSSYIDAFFGEDGFNNVVLYSNGTEVDPNKVRKKSSFPFKIPSVGKNKGNLKESTVDQLELVVDQFFITNRFIAPDVDFEFKIIVLNEEGGICFQKESSSHDGFDWTFGNSYTEDDLREEIDTGWLKDDNGVEIRICLDMFHHKAAANHVKNYAAVSLNSKNKSIAKAGSPHTPSTMYCLITRDKETNKETSKVTKFQGTKFPSTGVNCLEQVGCSAQYGDGYSTGMKETIFYNTAFARESGVAQSGIKNNFSPNYQLIQDILKSNQHASGVSWHSYLENRISEHRTYNRNWKNELAIREQEEVARQIIEANLSNVMDQEEIVDEIVEPDLDNSEELVVINSSSQGSPKGPAVNRNNWGSFKTIKEYLPDFVFPSSQQQIPFWYERKWNSSSEEYEDFIGINTASAFAHEWSKDTSMTSMIRAFAEGLRLQFSNHMVTGSYFRTNDLKERADITYETYRKPGFDQIIMKTPLSKRVNINLFDFLELVVTLKLKTGV